MLIPIYPFMFLEEAQLVTSTYISDIMAFVSPVYSTSFHRTTRRSKPLQNTCHFPNRTIIHASQSPSTNSRLRVTLAAILSFYCTKSFPEINIRSATASTITQASNTVQKSFKSCQQGKQLNLLPMLNIRCTHAATLDNGIKGKIAPSLTLNPSEDSFKVTTESPQFSNHSTTEHSLRHRVTSYLQQRGIPDGLVVFLLSSLPVLELRAGIPAGFLLDLSPVETFFLAVCGNLAPILPFLLLLRIPLVQSLASRYLRRARRIADSIGNADSRAAALALFVGVPLPGTGAWTASLIAFVLGMPIRRSLIAITSGVIMAATIVSVLCAMGKVGAAVVGIASIFIGVSFVRKALQRGREVDKV